MRGIVAAILLAIIATSRVAEVAHARVGALTDSSESERPQLRVFIDCQDCDVPYLQQSVAFVSYVRQPAVADIYVVVTGNATVAGGRRIDVLLNGHGSCMVAADTLSAAVPVLASLEEQRRTTARLLWVGLARVVARCGDQSVVDIPSLAVPPTPSKERDRWRGWSGTVSLAGHIAGQSKTSTVDGNIGLSVSRSTATDRYSTNASWNATSARYDIGEGQTAKSDIRGTDVQSLVAHGVSQHWTIGADAGFHSSTYANVATQVFAGGGVEYNICPYTESARHQLRIRYRMIATATDYREETLFGVTHESLGQHLLEISGDRVEIWGRASGGVELGQYLGVSGAYHARGWAAFSVRVSSRLTVDLNASGSRIHDQREISRAGASLEDVLLQRKLLDTLYDVNATVGLTLALGSIFSSVVNTRFGG